jgi:predicted nucleic acid-binding Zn ribbon protein
MPYYDYKCVETGEVFEYRQSIKDKPLEYWPKDVKGYRPKRKVVRLISTGVDVKLKGKGFYETDYK